MTERSETARPGYTELENKQMRQKYNESDGNKNFDQDGTF